MHHTHRSTAQQIHRYPVKSSPIPTTAACTCGLGLTLNIKECVPYACNNGSKRNNDKTKWKPHEWLKGAMKNVRWVHLVMSVSRDDRKPTCITATTNSTHNTMTATTSAIGTKCKHHTTHKTIHTIANAQYTSDIQAWWFDTCGANDVRSGHHVVTASAGSTVSHTNNPTCTRNIAQRRTTDTTISKSNPTPKTFVFVHVERSVCYNLLASQTVTNEMRQETALQKRCNTTTHRLNEMMGNVRWERLVVTASGDGFNPQVITATTISNVFYRATHTKSRKQQS
jgi:hypothetical protein